MKLWNLSLRRSNPDRFLTYMLLLFWCMAALPLLLPGHVRSNIGYSISFALYGLFYTLNMKH